MELRIVYPILSNHDFFHSLVLILSAFTASQFLIIAIQFL